MSELNNYLDEPFNDSPELLALYKRAKQKSTQNNNSANDAQSSAAVGQTSLQQLSYEERVDERLQNNAKKESEKKRSKRSKKQSSPEKPMTLMRKVLQIVSDIVFVVVCIALVGGSALFAVSKDPNKSYFGYRTYNVLTASMTPRSDGTSPQDGFRQGDVIIVKLCRPEDIREGDIITFNPSPNDPASTAYLTHRVVKVMDELGGKPGIYFVTRGDANNSDDPPIAGNALIGKKVASIPWVGGFLQKIQQHFVVSMIMIVAFFGCIFMLRWYFVKPKDDERSEPQKLNRCSL